MTALTEVNNFDSDIYQIETADAVLGGPGGIANLQAQQLANRTKNLNTRLAGIEQGTTVPPGVATETFVQNQLNRLDAKQSVRAATTQDIALTGLQTIDGVVLVSGDRVLVKNQNTGQDNGIYVAGGSAWTRATDADISAEVTSGMVVAIEQGTTQQNSRWQLTTDGTISLGVTSLVFADVTAGYAPLASPQFTGDAAFNSVTAVKVPIGTTGQRPAAADGLVRLNTTLNQYEGYKNGAWGELGGGATGAPGNKIFFENDQTVTADYTVTAGKNAMTAGPVTINAGVTVTVPNGSTWTIV